jgi:MOSC domain-containing protein
MKVAALTHYPVKSTGGEALGQATVDDRGFEHDRRWAAYTEDGGIASGKTTRRFRKVDGLLMWRSRVVDGRPELLGPDGAWLRVDDPAASAALSEEFGRSLQLRRETGIRHHDESGVHVVTTSSMRRVEQLVGGRFEPARVRANIVLETEGIGFVEDDWVGAELAVGPEVVLRLGGGMTRCVMVDHPRGDVAVLRALGQAHDLLLGLKADVVRPGVLGVGDTAMFVS